MSRAICSFKSVLKENRTQNTIETFNDVAQLSVLTSFRTRTTINQGVQESANNKVCNQVERLQQDE